MSACAWCGIPLEGACWMVPDADGTVRQICSACRTDGLPPGEPPGPGPGRETDDA
jgi:hypothetical protein